MTSRLASALSLISLLTLLQPAFPASQPLPILVADTAQADPAQHLLAVNLQGLANRHPDGPRVFLITHDRDADWLQYCLHLSPRETQDVTVAQLFEILRPELKGQILYDPGKPYTLDIATTAAGLHEAVISATDLGLPTVLDLRARWQSAADAYRWALATLLPQCSRTKAALLPSQAIAMRDFAIQHRLFTFSPPASPDDESLADILFRLAPGTALYGAAPPSLLPALSRASHFLVSAANTANLSFFSRLDAEQRFYQYLGYLDTSAPRYLSLIFDCSDLDFAVNHMPALWDHPARGTIPLGWAIPAALAEAAPPVLHRYYADAYRSGLDQFILGPSGAGQIDLSAASAPYTFFRATKRARTALDINSALYPTSPDPADTGAAVTRFAADTGARGVFLLGARSLPPLLYEGIPALPAPRVDSVGDAITYLNNIPLKRRCVALCLDPHNLTPADAAHIAAHVSDRYVPVPPEEMIELMRALALPSPAQPAPTATTTVTSPDSPQPDLPLPVDAVVDNAQNFLSASVVYRPVNHPLAFAEPMSRTRDGFSAQLPPLRSGGDFDLRIRARDRSGRVTWLANWTLHLPRADADSDGLADAEEHFLLTDPHSADTDADGLRDAQDPSALRPDHVFITYLGPIRPPSDLPYLPDPAASLADPDGRHLQPGQSCLYWLPLHRLPPRAPAIIALDASGPASLAVGASTDLLSPQFAGDLTAIWYSAHLSADSHPGGAFLRITCPTDAGAPLLIRALAVVSPPTSPSIARVSHRPAHPGPEQPITISALIFSPKEIAEARLAYRINDGGTIAIPMRQANASQYYQGRIPSLADRDRLEYWITARDPEGSEAATIPSFLPIGGRGREVVSLLATRDFYGDWTSAADWNGAARLASSPALRDSAPVNLTGGRYTVWLLAGGRGQGIALYVGEEKVGSLDPRHPDGWQRIGRIRLEAARHRVHLVSEAGPEAPPGAAPRYAAVIFSADSTFVPPADRVLDIYNSISLLFPPRDHTLTGRVELKATGAGNLSAADFSLDGELLRRVSGPPFHLSFNTRRFPNGPHTLRVQTVDRAGPTGLAVEIPVTIAN